MLEAILNVFFNFILGLFTFIPYSTLGYDSYSWANTLLECIGYFNSFIGVDIFLVAVGHAIFFFGVDMVWSIVEWIYKKMPGVD